MITIDNAKYSTVVYDKGVMFMCLHTVSLSELLLGVLHARYVCTWVSCSCEFSTLRLIMYLCVFYKSLVCLFVCLHISACEPEWFVARGSQHSVCLHLSELLLGVLHAQVDCVSLRICPLASHRCVSLLVRIWALDVWGELVPLKIFNQSFPVLKAGHSVSYS